MIFDPPPRRRAVARLLWPALIAVLAIAILVISASGEETRAELEYVEEVQSQSVEIAKGADAMRDVVSSLRRIDRTEFVTAIEGLREDLSVATQFVAEEPPTTSLIPVRALYRQALQAWDQGLLGYASAVLNAADDPTNVAVVDSMADSLALLRSGDSLYIDLVREMEREDVPGTLTAMPEVAVTPGEGALVSLSVRYVDWARSPLNGLALRPGLAVSQLVADPEWQVNPSEQAVVPATENIVFSVVVTNGGNVVTGAEPLTVTLTGGPEQLRVEEEVAPLQPNQQVTIVFEPLAVEPGGIYEVAAVLEVTGQDSNLEDNELRVQFAVNEA